MRLYSGWDERTHAAPVESLSALAARFCIRSPGRAFQEGLAEGIRGVSIYVGAIKRDGRLMFASPDAPKKTWMLQNSPPPATHVSSIFDRFHAQNTNLAPC